MRKDEKRNSKGNVFSFFFFITKKEAKKFWGGSMRYHIDDGKYIYFLALSSPPQTPRVGNER